MPTGRPSKQTQTAIAITQQSRLQQFNAQPSRLDLEQLLERSGKPTKLQQKIAVETVTRAGSIQAASLLHEWGSQHIASAHVTSQRNAYRTFSQLNSVMTMPMDDVTFKDMEAWTTAQKQMYIRHESSLLDGTAGNIIRITTTPLPDKEEEKPKGILGWLIGGWD
jgi:hypothetical protein